jgi:hypothetical protein
MKTLGRIASAALFIGLLLAIPGVVSAREVGVITGELVVLRGTTNQFRIVDHAGSYTAPAGVDLSSIDGKAVQVEIGADGRVREITVVNIPIDPITHGNEVVTGLLTVRDPVAGSFTIAGEGRVYVAPAGIDIRPYAGRMVDVHLDENGRLVSVDLARNSAVVAPVPRTDTCMFDGRSYAYGDASCQSGLQYRCEYGAWRNLGVECPVIAPQACNVGGVAYLEGATRCEAGARFACERGEWRSLGTPCGLSSRTCVVGGATVADGSSICREGTAYRCASGQWISSGRACS